MAVYWNWRTFSPFFVNEGQELNIHLDVMSGYLLLVSIGVNLAHARAAREAVQLT